MGARAGATAGGRLGRRIVAHFMLAASVPVLVLAMLAWSSFAAQSQKHAQQQLESELSADAMRVFDRLIAARAGLQLLATQRGTDTLAPPAMFAALAKVEGPSASADASALERWWRSALRDTARTLHIRREGVGARATLVLSQPGPGRALWLAEINPVYLWSDAFESIDAGRARVLDPEGRELHANGSRASLARADDTELMRATHRLFLRKEFGTDDWLFRAERQKQVESAENLPVGDILVKVVLAALLLVAVLSLVQVRRTMDPLGRLVAATRRLAQQDYAARVALAGADDEFSELGRAFNDMAAQMQHHVREREMHEQRLNHDATHDSLTGLLNRAGLRSATEAALHAARPFALMFVDLDRFKSVNDSLGHQAGDQLLRQAADRLVATLPPDAVVARPGGDEFVVLVDAGDDRAPQRLAQALCDRLAEAFEIEGREFVLGASIGWARHPDDARDADTLARRADLAMYASKELGRGRVTRYEPRLDQAAEQRAWLVNDLPRAVERGQLVVHYQPRVDARDGRARSAEALVRWRHPQRGLVSPAAFIPVAEETGAIREIGRWVLDEACRQVAAWRREGVAIERVSVNLSAVQLGEATLYDTIVATVARHGLAPANLELEITESAVVGDTGTAAELLGRLRRLGIAIALDDFGTGYSSMAYLSRMPVDVIKIDRAFVQGLGREASADGVTRAIVALAKSLNLALVAEGVETAEQASRLGAMGCDELQGFLYARPVPAADYARLACVVAEAAVDQA